MKQFLTRHLQSFRARLKPQRLSAEARRQRDRDARGLPPVDPGAGAVVTASLRWLCEAQDRSASRDGGVARAYHLNSGWTSSYPETTGYIVPTFLQQAHRSNAGEFRERTRRMLDWLARIQLPCGAFQGGKIDSVPVVPVVFNTGQVLLGLAAGEREFGQFLPAMQRAADWLVETQDPDGCWHRGASPFAQPGVKAYDTHVAWGLFEAARLIPDRGYQAAGMANVRWALTQQRPNGWIDNCCLSDSSRPLTHTLGYALRGIVEAYRYSGESDLLAAARRTAAGLLGVQRSDGSLPGRLTSAWRPAAPWVCLTGLAQIAECWLALYQDTSDASYREAAFAATGFLRRTVQIEGPPEIRGAVAGSFPIDGDYSPFEFPNWAAKFLIDALWLEETVRRNQTLRVVA